MGRRSGEGIYYRHEYYGYIDKLKRYNSDYYEAVVGENTFSISRTGTGEWVLSMPWGEQIIRLSIKDALDMINYPDFGVK